ncbi:DNA polymerase Y family protein [Limibaculum sp. M0105]|uniref:DNA-directed DNA polymerase n=1 Tax=Thermohalobaculum xanthum TaxID=2753746 RepID=A0A8J7M799_9RHOB|nr:DNA polymerase Y family protein [Thermohalobaculum xanthum]MBK0399591.1 DNA polymerase Y family protein [Thermohalobaculum xanthum]
MPRRRIISVALPHLGAECRLRHDGQADAGQPFAVTAQEAGTLRLVSVNRAAAAAELAAGMVLTDARAICPGLATRPAEPERLADFRRALVRWAGRFSPTVGLDTAEPGAGALLLDATGVAHLFGGEADMLSGLLTGLGKQGLSARAAMADNRGAAWALAHFGRERAVVVPRGQVRAALGPLPVSALRLEPATAEALAATGLRTIGDVAGVPRGALARRFGVETMRRLDQALGIEPEPVTALRATPVFAARLTLPEPIGLVSDVMAGLERLLERVCHHLEREQRGARAMRLSARRVDGADQTAMIRLARPMRDPMRLRALFQPKVEAIEAGFGIDALRLEAIEAEALPPAQTGAALHGGAPTQGQRRATEDDRLADLIARVGNRIGFEAVIRLLPAESHIPERAFIMAAAAWSGPGDWQPRHDPNGREHAARPITLFPPEPVTELDPGQSAPIHPPARFRWRGRTLATLRATGPERIAPEWWWDDPAWRGGARDYWRVETAEGPRLWLFHTPQANWPAWHVQGEFA